MQQMHPRHAAALSLPPVPALCNLLLTSCLRAQSAHSNRLCDSSSCSMPNNIPSAVSMLPQNKQSAASDALCTPLGSEQLSEAPSKQHYDASVLLRAPLRTLNRADHSDTGLGKNAVRQHPSGVPALDSALRGVHVYKLSNGGMESLHNFAQKKISEHKLKDNFYAFDVGRLHRLHQAFTESMPRVRPFYAVKCNPDPVMLRVLANLGCGFDCASAKEIATVLDMGVAPERIVFAHPCKRPLDLEYAVARNVMRMTFDCVDELEKVALECPHAEMVLRIRADDPSAVVQFGHKYGADPVTEVPVLLAAAKRLGMNVVGVSFHVGSGSQSCDAYEHAIEAARRVFDHAAEVGYNMQLLDLGGGFWGRFDACGNVPLEDVSDAINSALERFFPPDGGGRNVEVIAEPGRYFAEACATMYAMVTTVKDRPDGTRSYYITDGVYGSFNNLVYDHGSVTAKVLRGPEMPPVKRVETDTRLPSTVFGPTCDGVDLIFKNVPMPMLRRGDWLQFPNFGAYTIAGACAFNGLPVDSPDILYVYSDEPTGSWEHSVAMLRKGADKDNPALQAPEHHLCFVADLHDLDSIC